MALEGRPPLLGEWRVRAIGHPDGVAARGARLLAQLGAIVAEECGSGEFLEVDGHGRARVGVTGWDGERPVRERCGVASTERAAGDVTASGPRGMVAAQYLGALAAAAALRVAVESQLGSRSPGATQPTLGTIGEATALAGGLVEGIDPAATAAEALACADGWVVARWRQPSEPALLAAVLAASSGSPSRTGGGLDLRDCGVEAVWAAARDCRLLVAPVRPPGLPAEPPLLDVRRRVRPAADGFHRAHSGSAHSTGRRLRVVDWTPLWAGPWATGRLADQGHLVTRVEPPARRDGLLGTARGRACWRRWNGAKSLALLDARQPEGRRALGALIAGSDVLVTGMTPRVLPQLGLDDDWFAGNAPHLLRVELVGFDEPNHDLPAVGEQAAAFAGLLSPERRGDPPFPPLPWPDPLLGANCLVAIRAWEAAGRPSGVRIRLSLEDAARSAVRARSAPGAWLGTQSEPRVAEAIVSRRGGGAR